MTPPDKTILYEGKAKQLLPGPEKGLYVMRFKDSATAFNNKKKAEIPEKGQLNQRISAAVFHYLKENGVDSHYVKSLNDTEMLVRAVEIIPLEVIVRNIAAGSLCRKFGVKEGIAIEPPMVEFSLKNDDLDDPLLTDEHIRLLKLATPDELTHLRKMALRINDLMKAFFMKLGIVLVDFKIEFGRDTKGNILLADEITPDGCRLWDAKTKEILDKDRFRKDLGGLIEAYKVVWERMQKGHA